MEAFPRLRGDLLLSVSVVILIVLLEKASARVTDERRLLVRNEGEELLRQIQSATSDLRRVNDDLESERQSLQRANEELERICEERERLLKTVQNSLDRGKRNVDADSPSKSVVTDDSVQPGAIARAWKEATVEGAVGDRAAARSRRHFGRYFSSSSDRNDPARANFEVTGRAPQKNNDDHAVISEDSRSSVKVSGSPENRVNVQIQTSTPNEASSSSSSLFANEVERTNDSPGRNEVVHQEAETVPSMVVHTDPDGTEVEKWCEECPHDYRWGRCRGSLVYRHNFSLTYSNARPDATLEVIIGGPVLISCVEALRFNRTRAAVALVYGGPGHDRVKLRLAGFRNEGFSYVLKRRRCAEWILSCIVKKIGTLNLI